MKTPTRLGSLSGLRGGIAVGYSVPLNRKRLQHGRQTGSRSAAGTAARSVYLRLAQCGVGCWAWELRRAAAFVHSVPPAAAVKFPGSNSLAGASKVLRPVPCRQCWPHSCQVRPRTTIMRKMGRFGLPGAAIAGLNLDAPDFLPLALFGRCLALSGVTRPDRRSHMLIPASDGWTGQAGCAVAARGAQATGSGDSANLNLQAEFGRCFR